MSRLPVKITEHGTKVTFATTCLHNGIVPGLFIRGDSEGYSPVTITQSRILHRLRTIPRTFPIHKYTHGGGIGFAATKH